MPTLNTMHSPTLKYAIFVSAARVNEWLHIGYSAPRKHFGHKDHKPITATATKTRAVPLLAEALYEFFLNETTSLKHTSEPPLTLVELGCGTGYVPVKLNTMDSIFAVGVDGSSSIELLGERYRQADLTSPLRINADWVISFEVGEHLPVASSAAFFRTMIQARRGVIMAWARPGQGGNGHINELSVRRVMRELLSDPQLVYDEAAVALLRKTLGKDLLSGFRYYANLVVFRRVHAGARVPFKGRCFRLRRRQLQNNTKASADSTMTSCVLPAAKVQAY